MAVAADIERFLEEIAALADLDVLLWLRGRRGLAIATPELEVAVGADGETLLPALDRLSEAGLIARDAAGRWSYAAGGSNEPTIAAVEELCSRDRAAVLAVLSRQAMARIRRAAVRQLVRRGD